jgi:hypothetical protein
MKIRVLTLLALFALAVAPVSLFAQTSQPAQSPQASQGTCCPAPTQGTCCPAGTTGGTTGGFAADLSLYGGYVWPKSFSDLGEFKGSQIFGLRGGFFVTPGFEIGGNYYWNSHFQPRRSNELASFAGDLGFPQGAVRANVWEVEFTYNFGRRALFGSAVSPYVVGGIGGLTTSIKNQDSFVLNTSSFFVPGATPLDLQIGLQNNNLQNVLPGLNTTNGVAFVGTPFGTNVFVPNDVLDRKDTFLTFSYGGGLKATRLWGPMGLFGDFRGRTVPNFFGHGNTWPEISAGLNFSWGEK